MRKLLLACVLVVPSVASAQADLAAVRPLVAARYPDVRWVTPAELERRDGPVLLDAREADEYAVSHLRGARRVDPDRERFDDLGIARDALVVVYCSVGWRSGTIADRMRSAGFTRVYNLEGGIFAWANAGKPLYRGSRRVRSVHPYDAVWGRLLDRRRHAYAPR